jgi:hypothetical protein
MMPSHLSHFPGCPLPTGHWPLPILIASIDVGIPRHLSRCPLTAATWTWARG